MKHHDPLDLVKQVNLRYFGEVYQEKQFDSMSVLYRNYLKNRLSASAKAPAV